MTVPLHVVQIGGGAGRNEMLKFEMCYKKIMLVKVLFTPLQRVQQ